MPSKEWASTGMNENEISMASSDENFSPPPTYTEAVSRDNASASNAASPSAFGATTELYIQAKGITPNTALFDTKPDPIPIFRLQPGTSLPPQFQGPEYISLRLKSSSNSCALVRGSDHTQTPLNSTIYRWGPGRPPRIRIFPSNSSLSVEDAIGTENLKCDEVVVKSRSMFSRTQKIVTPFGEFQWRYGDRAERKKAFDANSLLIMEKVDSIDVPGGKSEKRHIRVAQLIRNDELRTLGTDKYGAGNGGRLMIDIKIWEGEKESEAAKIEAFMVASCICMLKREADRMRDNMTAAIV